MLDLMDAVHHYWEQHTDIDYQIEDKKIMGMAPCVVHGGADEAYVEALPNWRTRMELNWEIEEFYKNVIEWDEGIDDGY